jgi:sialidase-1
MVTDIPNHHRKRKLFHTFSLMKIRIPRRASLASFAALQILSFGGSALAKTPQILETKIISQEPGAYCAWPTVGRRRSGELWAVYSGGREYHLCPFGRVHAMVSRDNGRSWSWPRVLLDTALDDRDAGFLETSKGTLLVTTVPARSYEAVLRTGMAHVEYTGGRWTDAPLSAEQRTRWEAAFRPVRDAGLKPGQVLLRSTDGGATWSAPIDTLVNAPHGPIQLRDGRLLYVGKQWWISSPKLSACESSDDGQTWQLLSDLPTRAGDDLPQYCEPHAVETEDGKILVQWRYPRVGLLQSVSTDGGRTWSPPEPLFYGFPPHLLRLRDGRLLTTYGHRRAPFGNQARVSSDNGTTWGEPFLLTGADTQVDLGYPSTVELDDATLLTTYYEWLPQTRRAAIHQIIWKLPGRETAGEK